MEDNVELIKKRIKEVEVIFFDLDGTLIDTEKVYFRFWKEASKFFGHELSDEEALNMRSLESVSGRAFLESLGLDYDKVRNKRIELMKEYYSHHEIEIKPYAKEFLKYLKSLNKRIYIVTANKIEKARNIIDQIHFENYIDGVISAKDVMRGKPFPDVFVFACQQVKKEPWEVIVFEDSPNGLKASYKAGCFTVMVEDMTPYTKDMDYVHASISSFKSLLS